MKIYKYWHLCLALLLSIGCLSCAQNKVTFELKDDEKLIEFTTDRFTLPNLHITPNGKNIIFDVLGDIYQVPIEGGKAEVLLQDNNWKRAGKLSTDGKMLAYVSDETGEFQVWTINLETKEKRIYPIKEFFHYPLYAYWKDKNNLLIPSKEGLQNFDVRTGETYLLRAAKEEERNIMHTTNNKMTVNKTGTYAYYQFDDVLWAYDLNENIDKYIGKLEENRKKTLARISPNGQKALYFGLSSEEPNVIELKYWNLESNTIKSLYKTNDLGFSTNLDYSFYFIDDKAIILDKEGEIVRMDIETGEYETIPIEVDVKKVIKKPLIREPKYIKDSIITASVLRNPVTRPGLDTIYFGAFGKLHSYSKTTGIIKEIYPDEDRFEVSPGLSPDGKYIAYTTWNDTEMGHVCARELSSGKEYQLTKTPGRYINPAWSPDGTEVVFVADETEAKMGIGYQKKGSPTHNHLLDLYKVKFSPSSINDVEKIKIVLPFAISAIRYYPLPVFSNSGFEVYITTRSRGANLPVLLRIDLATKEVLDERVIPFHTDEIVISPDGQHIALIFDEQVWVDSFPHALKLEFDENSDFIPIQAHYNGGYVNNILLPEAKSVYEVAPSYLYWQDENILMWGSAEEVYTYDVRTGKTEKIADIKVQKPRAIPKAQYALTNARIITINKQDEVIEKGTILIKDNRIEAVGKVEEIMIPKTYKVFDLEGKTIMPGLIDVHAHYHHINKEFLQKQDFQYVGNLAYGVTTIYDPSVNVLDYRERAQMVEIGQVLGPRVFASGNIIIENTRESRYKKVQKSADADRIINSAVKLDVSGPIKEYGVYNSNIRRFLYHATQNKKIKLTSHLNSFHNSLSRIIRGYSAIEHEISSFDFTIDVLNLITKSEVNYTPTYMVRPGIGDVFIDKTIQEKSKLIRFNGELLYHNNYAHAFDNQNLERQDDLKRWNNRGRDEHVRATATLKKIINLGGKVSVGGHGNPLPGIGTHWELWFMTKGISNYQALQAATINGAEKLDLQEEIGSIQKGRLADLVILNNDPLENIFNTIDILYTIQNGNIYEAETMKQIHPIKKELRLWGWDSPKMH